MLKYVILSKHLAPLIVQISNMSNDRYLPIAKVLFLNKYFRMTNQVFHSSEMFIFLLWGSRQTAKQHCGNDDIDFYIKNLVILIKKNILEIFNIFCYCLDQLSGISCVKRYCTLESKCQ